jgi:hypothetical protein
VVVSLSSRALRPHGSKMARNMILNRGVSTSLIAWRTWGGQHEDRLKAEVIEIGLKKRSACVFEASKAIQTASSSCGGMGSDTTLDNAHVAEDYLARTTTTYRIIAVGRTCSVP